jgi:uncharacterized protein YfaP (DUF2135 family)
VRRSVVRPVPVLLAPPGGGATVTLLWDGPVDLDLYVTDPSLETFYFANRGAAFERDARCADETAGPRSEVARWSTPPPGRYRVGVDFPEACAGASLETMSYRLVIDVSGQREVILGQARRGQRVPVVREFEVVRP